MKLLFVFLLIANLVAFAAQFALEPAVPPTASVGQEGNLRLLSERSASAGGANAGASCFTLGPFSDLRLARYYEQELRHRGYQASVSEREIQEPLGYWVYLPPAATLQAAQASIKRLTERGITDFALVAGTENANAISLGLYAEQANAQARVRQLEQLGIASSLERRYAPQLRAELWLELARGEPPELGARHRWTVTDCQARSD